MSAAMTDRLGIRFTDHGKEQFLQALAEQIGRLRSRYPSLPIVGVHHGFFNKTAGALFDYLSGRLRRAPTLFTNYGLEWCGRLLIEPRRLWRRYLLGNPLFLWRVLRQRFSYNYHTEALPIANESQHLPGLLPGLLRKHGRSNWKFTR